MAKIGVPGDVTPQVRLARQIALGVPALLIAGAYISQYGFDLYPCEMCWWQRYPHFAAILLALLSYILVPKRLWISLAAGGILTSGLIGGFHAGVEYGWWEGITGCSGALVREPGTSALDAITSAPLIRCDRAPWHFLGVSLAGWNFIVSGIAGLAVFVLLAKGRTR